MKRTIKRSSLLKSNKFFGSLIALLIFIATSGLVRAQCPPPVITPSGATDLCSGQSVTLTSSAGVSYLWSNGATTQAIVAASAGSYVVTVDDGAGCIVASDPTVVTKFANIPQRPSTVVGPSKVCPGETWRYTINKAKRAAFYTWTLPVGATSGGLSVVNTTDTIIDVDFDVNFLGAVTMSVIANNGCGVSAVRNKALYRRNPVKPTVINSPDFTCPGGSYSFSVPFDPGTDNYTWSYPAGAGISGQGNDTVMITFPVGYVSGSVSVVAENGCGTSNPKVKVSPAYAANPDSIYGPTSGLCGTTQIYTVNPVVGATSYTWTAPVGSSVSSGQGTTTAGITFNSSLLNAYVKVASVNVCGSKNNRKLLVKGGVSIDTQPSDVDACRFTQAILTIGVPGSGISFQWVKDGVNLVNGGNISGANNDTLTIASADAADAGYYYCFVSNACSSPLNSDSAQVTINDPIGTPPGAISGIDVACAGTLGQAFSIAPVPGATSYLWTPYHGAVIASGQGSTAITVDFGPSTFSGYYIDVRAVNGCGVSDSTRKWVRRTVSVPDFNTVPTVACAGQAGVVYAIDTVPGALSYNWAVSGGNIVSGQGSTSIVVDFDPGFTTGTVCVSATNQCVTTADRCENIISTPATPGQIQGAGNNVCNSTQAYSINPVLGATGYTWTVGTGASINSGQGTTSISVDFGPGYVTDTVRVSANNGCGTSSDKVKQVNAFPAKIPSILGNSGPCANSSGNAYSVNPVTGATSYSWSVFPGATLAGGQGTSAVTVDFGPTDGIISVAPVNGCGAGYNTNLRITFTCRIAGTSQIISVALFPNPASDQLFVQQPADETVSKIAIMDMTGKTVYVLEHPVAGSDGIFNLDINSLTPGIYIIELNAGGNKFNSRFVKE